MHQFDDDVMAAARAAPERAEPTSAEARGAALAPDAAAVLELQRQAGNEAVAQLLAADGARDEDPHGLGGLVGSGGGAALPADTRVQMESAFGTDFSSVRIHTGGEADASARSLGAHAYTAGEDVVFASGRYDPGSAAGQRTLAHELTHVVQQRSGPVEGTDDGTGVRVSDPSDRFERAAEAAADHVVAGLSADGAAPVQREPAAGDEPVEEAVEEADAVQALAVQRQAEAGGEEPMEEEPAAG